MNVSGTEVSGFGRWSVLFMLLFFPALLPSTLRSASPAGPELQIDSVTDGEDRPDGFRPLDTLWRDAGTFFTDAWELLRVPGGWGREDFVRFGVVSAAGAGVFVLDEEMRDEIRSWRGTDGDAIVDAVDHFGHNSVGLIAGGTLYLPGLLLDLPWLRRAGLHLTQTLLYSAAVGAILKGTFGRARPFLAEGPHRFRGPWQNENSWMSLPSGHTVVAFSIASTLAATISRSWATVLLYGAASLTAIGRLYLDQHWGSDVFIGAALTSAIGHGVVSLSKRTTPESTDHHPRSPTSSFSIAPGYRELRAVWSLRW